MADHTSLFQRYVTQLVDLCYLSTDRNALNSLLDMTPKHIASLNNLLKREYDVVHVKYLSAEVLVHTGEQTQRKMKIS